jgi:hypothetical protein
MRQTFHPAIFLGTVILLCTAWLWARPPVPVVPTFARGGAPRPAVVARESITLDPAILGRYAGRYEGRGGFAIELTLKDGKLLGQLGGSVPFELGATSETEFFVKGMGYDVRFDVADDGTVRGFASDTEFGLIQVKRVR